jgi:ABC-2 type transport system permease protein
MRDILTIAKKEWRSYFTSPVGYVFAGLLLIVASWMYFGDLFILGQANLQPYWAVMGFLFSIFVPAISMNLIAEEKKNSTWELLLSLPITEIELALGKFIGCALYLLLVISLSIPAIVTVYLLGKPDLGLIVGGYLGIIMLGLAYLSLGMFMSSLSTQAIVGFLGSTVVLIINNLLGQEMFLVRMPGILRDLVGGLSLSLRSTKFYAGLIEISDLIFFISWIFIFITLTVISLKMRDK